MANSHEKLGRNIGAVRRSTSLRILSSIAYLLGPFPLLSNSWIIGVIWLYVALHSTPNIDCYWVGAVPNIFVMLGTSNRRSYDIGNYLGSTVPLPKPTWKLMQPLFFLVLSRESENIIPTEYIPIFPTKD